MKNITVGLVDDHQLFLESLVLMLNSFSHYEVVLEAFNGRQLQEKIIANKLIPDIVLIDVNMPVMDGVQTTRWLQENYPAVKTVALSMNDNNNKIIEMIRAGCCAYLLKDIAPLELDKALQEISAKGVYNADLSNINYRRLLLTEMENNQLKLSEKERTFLQLACSDWTYKKIASDMGLSEKTIDGYRDALFKKFNVQSRVGLILEAIKRELVVIE